MHLCLNHLTTHKTACLANSLVITKSIERVCSIWNVVVHVHLIIKSGYIRICSQSRLSEAILSKQRKRISTKGSQNYIKGASPGKQGVCYTEPFSRYPQSGNFILIPSDCKYIKVIEKVFI